jgi:Domain of Unknown Function (DUF1080)
MRLSAFLLSAAVAFVLGLSPRDDEGFQPLVRGDDPKQFELVGIGPETIKIADGEIRVTGQPNGYFATKDSFRNYVLRFEWKYDRPDNLKSDADFDGNSGLLIHIAGPHKVWPDCIEVQLANPDAGHIFKVGKAEFQGTKDAAAQKRAIKPVGQWNEEEVICKDGSVVCKINGVEVARGDGAKPDHGQIAWQSEGRPIRFRNLRIKPLD